MNARKVCNVILDAVVALHLTYTSIAMSRAVIPQEILPIDTAYGGKFKYLTFWNVVSIDIIMSEVETNIKIRILCKG